MGRRARNLTQADRDTWAQYARQVKTLPGRVMPEAAPVAAAVAPRVAAAAEVTVPARGAGASGRGGAGHLVTGLQPPGLDNGTWARLRGGRMAPQRTLDLHGRTVQAAYHALLAFLHRAHTDHLRCVEVITGRGSGENGGAIRREFQLWLNLPSIRPLVLGATHPHKLNPGSTVLLLKRPAK